MGLIGKIKDKTLNKANANALSMEWGQGQWLQKRY
jgi:hypothetical protein